MVVLLVQAAVLRPAVPGCRAAAAAVAAAAAAAVVVVAVRCEQFVFVVQVLALWRCQGVSQESYLPQLHVFGAAPVL